MTLDCVAVGVVVAELDDDDDDRGCDDALKWAWQMRINVSREPTAQISSGLSLRV